MRRCGRAFDIATKNHLARGRLQHARNGDVGILANQSACVVDNDHRAIVEAADTLALLLLVLNAVGVAVQCASYLPDNLDNSANSHRPIAFDDVLQRRKIVWLDPTGREVKGNELRVLRERPIGFPPAITKGQKPWRLKFRGYQHDDILTQTVKTDADGAAQLQFTPEREGYYRVAWESSQVLPGASARLALSLPSNRPAYTRASA